MHVSACFVNPFIKKWFSDSMEAGQRSKKKFQSLKALSISLTTQMTETMKFKVAFCKIITVVYAVRVDPPCGPIEGFVETLGSSSIPNDSRSVLKFLGIPYSLPPVGRRRFLPPEPIPSWNEVYNATYHRPVCPQTARFDVDEFQLLFVGDEDCLHLNVYTPRIPITKTATAGN